MFRTEINNGASRNLDLNWVVVEVPGVRGFFGKKHLTPHALRVAIAVLPNQLHGHTRLHEIAVITFWQVEVFRRILRECFGIDDRVAPLASGGTSF